MKKWKAIYILHTYNNIKIIQQTTSFFGNIHVVHRFNIPRYIYEILIDIVVVKKVFINDEMFAIFS